MKRFVSWAAVSSRPQAEKVSLQDQLERNREHVLKWGGTLVEELVVPGQSRDIVLFEEACRKIDAYQRLKELLEEKAFDVLIYMDRSRLGRKASLSMAVTELCYEAGVLCYEIENPPPSLELERSYDELIIGAFKSVGYQNEVVKTQARRKAGMIDRVKKGEFPAAVPYGWIARYNEDGTRRIELHEAQATTIRLILVEMYLDRGMGEPDICAELDRRGIPPPRTINWATSGINGMLGMVWRYAGWSEYNKNSKDPYIRTRGNWPQILTEEEAEAIVTERKERLGGRRSVASRYCWSRVVWCRACGKPMSLEIMIKPTTVRLYSYARCRVCTQASKFVRISYIQAALRAAIEFLFDETNRQEVLAVAPSREDAVLTEIARLQQELVRLRSGQQRADDAYTQGYMDAERYYRQVDRLKAQSQELEQEIAKLQAALEEERYSALRPHRLQEIADHGLAMLDHPDTKIANAWLRRHFRVWAENGKVVEIEYL